MEIKPYLAKARNEIWYTEKYINTIIKLFEAKELPKEMWTNDAHIIVWLHYCLKYPNSNKAMDTLRDNIVLHNESVWTKNTTSSGYHETITRFRKETLQVFIDNSITNDLYVLANEVLSSKLASKDYIFNFYSKNTIKDSYSRMNYIKPDSQD